MKLARTVVADRERFVVKRGNDDWRLLPPDVQSTADAIERWEEIGDVDADAHTVAISADQLTCPVVSPHKIIAIGLNYRDHIVETGSRAPERPLVFAKFSNALLGPNGDIVMDPELTAAGDYEVELAVVMGRRSRWLTEEEALDAVFGYTVANDVSARDWQKADRQFDRSKSFDTFCPIGPWITTRDEVGDPQRLRLRTWVDGELRQDSTTAEMIFPVAHLISFLSRSMTLEAGDVILTGTPPGVGMGFRPPRYLTPPSVVECEVEGLGRIVNNVVSPVHRATQVSSAAGSA